VPTRPAGILRHALNRGIDIGLALALLATIVVIALKAAVLQPE
jgi:hypothetical protein